MYKYDFALSFAGEERKIAEQLALKLVENGIRVFYDNYELHHLWGEDLAENLNKIYSSESKFCIMIVSKNYIEKMWTTHERKSALEKQIRQRGGYILPIIIDDVSIPGLPNTIGHIKLEDYSLDQIVNLLKKKLGLFDAGNVENIKNYQIAERTEILAVPDVRIDRHKSFSDKLFVQNVSEPFFQFHSLFNEKVSISENTLKETFLNTDRRYSESLFYSKSPITHFSGYTRELYYFDPDERIVEAVTCYYDGQIVTEGYIDENKLNPNYFLYAIHRHLQLTKEILEKYDDEFRFLLKFANLEKVKWQLYNNRYPLKSIEYSGYHDDINILIKLDEIFGREKWNNKMIVVEQILIKIARMFGLSSLPQSYWDENEILLYANLGDR